MIARFIATAVFPTAPASSASGRNVKASSRAERNSPAVHAARIRLTHAANRAEKSFVPAANSAARAEAAFVSSAAAPFDHIIAWL
jgi:hypothetical protein